MLYRKTDVVRLGQYSHKNTTFDSAYDFEVKEFISHQDFKWPQFYNDIGLIRLMREVTLKPACIPTSPIEEQYFKAELTICGWGWSKPELKIYSDELKATETSAIEPWVCEFEYYSNRENDQLPKGIIDTQFCAKNDEEKSDTCEGDSGGPIQLEIDDRTWILGITSFGPKICSDPNQPGVYTRVSEYYNWIREHSGYDNCELGLLE